MTKTFVALKCPFCGSDRVGKNGLNNGKQRYLCKNPKCLRKTFFAEYTYNACKPDIKVSILKLSVNGNGTRAISRCLGIHQDTVTAELKKKKTK
jgi:transposase-like protein